MQSEGKEEIKRSRTPDNQVEPELELSEAWQTLLGMQSTNIQAQVNDRGDKQDSKSNQHGQQGEHEASERKVPQTFLPQGQEGSGTPPSLPDDPWSRLVQTQGIQVVDLQQLHLHATHVPLSDSDVEQVLKMMEEAPSQYGSQE